MIQTAHLFSPLHQKLMELLRSLTMEEWLTPTIARQWVVKDVAAHLLDTNLRLISLYRDNYTMVPDTEIKSYKDLVDYLNRLNAEWVNASKRISPQQLIELIDKTGPEANAIFSILDMQADAAFSVAWAGETVSKNWFHTAREFTEKWHHQQQIRDAVKKEGIMTREFFYPVMDTFLRGLPHIYRNVEAKEQTAIKIEIRDDIGGEWILVRKKQYWAITQDSNENICSTIRLDPDTAWKLFTKGLNADQAKEKATIEGNFHLAEHAFRLIAVMA